MKVKRMDFIEFLKSSCYYSDVRIDIRDDKIYKGQTSEYTGFSLYELNDYEIRVDYCGSATGYTLQCYSSDCHIYKGGSYTGYDLRRSGYGDLRLYHGGSLYGEGDYMKEREETATAEEEVETSSYSTSASSSDNDDLFSNGFWSWHSWLVGLAYAAGFTFSAGGVIAAIVSPWLFLAAPGFMVLWAILLIIRKIHKIRKKRK